MQCYRFPVSPQPFRLKLTGFSGLLLFFKDYFITSFKVSKIWIAKKMELLESYLRVYNLIIWVKCLLMMQLYRT